MEEAEVVFMAPQSFRLPDDARTKKEFEQVVSLMDMGDGRLRITKIGGIPLADTEDYEPEYEEEETVTEEASEEVPASLSQAISMERSSRGV